MRDDGPTSKLLLSTVQCVCLNVTTFLTVGTLINMTTMPVPMMEMAMSAMKRAGYEQNELVRMLSKLAIFSALAFKACT